MFSPLQLIVYATNNIACTWTPAGRGLELPAVPGGYENVVAQQVMETSTCSLSARTLSVLMYFEY